MAHLLHFSLLGTLCRPKALARVSLTGERCLQTPSLLPADMHEICMAINNNLGWSLIGTRPTCTNAYDSTMDQDSGFRNTDKTAGLYGRILCT